MQINGLTVLISGDYNAFSEGWNGAGVYMCSGNYKSETFKQPIYIGSSIDLQYRIETQHIINLNRNNHFNNPLQVSWNKHSENEGFVWFLLESCPPNQTLIIEQKYLDLYRSFVDEFGGFNIAHCAEATQKGRSLSQETKDKISKANKGKKHSKQTKQKISLATKGKNNPFYGKKHSNESKKTISEKNKTYQSKERNPFYGKRHSLESIKKIANGNSKFYIFLNPQGQKIEIFNLNKFCRENHLQVAAMSRVYHGEQKQHFGWTKN